MIKWQTSNAAGTSSEPLKSDDGAVVLTYFRSRLAVQFHTGHAGTVIAAEHRIMLCPHVHTHRRWHATTKREIHEVIRHCVTDLVKMAIGGAGELAHDRPRSKREGRSSGRWSGSFAARAMPFLK